MESNSTNSTPATTGYHLEIDSGSELSANQNKTNGNDSETPRSSKRTTETAQTTTTTTTSSSFVVVSGGNNDSSSRRSCSSPSRRNKTRRRISSTEGIGTAKPPPLPASNSILKVALQNWLPARYDVEKQKEDNKNKNNNNNNNTRLSIFLLKKHPRSLKRRCFLFMTEPETSIGSAIWFGLILFTVSLLNIIMILQTMSQFQFTPTDCVTCGGTQRYVFDESNDISKQLPTGVTCMCPPAPLEWTDIALHWMVNFFAIEWLLRVALFEPPLYEKAKTCLGRFRQWLGFCCRATTILDALAVFPYYVESLSSSNGLMSLRLLRLFRVLQLVRFGQYNKTFTSFSLVVYKSIPYLKLMMSVFLFGAAFFGSMVYWLEKGIWQYYPDSNDFRFIRQGITGGDEISPYVSIPGAFWWFFVTATGVGYGDMYPTSHGGRWVATFAMLMGVLVIAFPASVFSDLWSNELRKQGALDALEKGGPDDDSDSDSDSDSEEEDRGRKKHRDQHRDATQSANRNSINHDPIVMIQNDEERGNGTAISEEETKVEDEEITTTDDITGGSPPVTTKGNRNSSSTTDLDTNMVAAAAAFAGLAGSTSVELDDKFMVIEKDDIVTLVSSVHAILNSHKGVKRILKKYKQKTKLAAE